jgi:hypothetical protein
MEHPDRLVKTSVYLPANVVAQVRAAAQRRGVSSAALIRAAIAAIAGEHRPPPVGGFLSRNTSRNTDESREEYD